MVDGEGVGMSLEIVAPRLSGCTRVDPSYLQRLEFHTGIEEYHWEWAPDLSCWGIDVCLRGDRLSIWVPSCQVNRSDDLVLDEHSTGGLTCDLH